MARKKPPQPGEFELIDIIEKKAFKPAKSSGILGIGDDCSVIPPAPDEDTVVTTDALVENTHFKFDYYRPEDVGYKALAVNLSDLAAMAAEPVGYLLSLAIRPGIGGREVEGIIAGMNELSRAFRCPLLGGNVARTEGPFNISITVLGRCRHKKAILRSKARAGDLLIVSGTLGDSRAGLEILSKGERRKSAAAKYLREKHLRPQPRLALARKLAGYGAHAMIDISDGLAGDLRHICEASQCSAIIDLEKLPVSDALKQYADKTGMAAHEYAALGGEDYELLAAMPAAEFERFSKAGAGKTRNRPRLSVVGKIVERRSTPIEWRCNGTRADFNFAGFDHLK